MTGECGDTGKLASLLCPTARSPDMEGGNAGSGRFPLSLSSPLEAIFDFEALAGVGIEASVDGIAGGQRFTILDTFAPFGLALMPSNELRGSAELVVAGV